MLSPDTKDYIDTATVLDMKSPSLGFPSFLGARHTLHIGLSLSKPLISLEICYDGFPVDIPPKINARYGLYTVYVVWSLLTCFNKLYLIGSCLASVIVLASLSYVKSSPSNVTPILLVTSHSLYATPAISPKPCKYSVILLYSISLAKIDWGASAYFIDICLISLIFVIKMACCFVRYVKIV
jgi:hypothetical protein